MERLMDKIYYDPANPGGLAGINKLREAVKEQTGVSPALSDVKEFLFSQDAYTLHAPAFKNFSRRRVLVSGIDKQFQADIVDMSEYSSANDNIRYLLTCIDVFSKYAWVRCLKTKSGLAVTKAFRHILSEGRVPVKLQTDYGGEFYNKHFKELMREYNIQHFSTMNETKASVVERFNRTLKSKMWRYLTAVNTQRYIDRIDDMLLAYNNSYHRSIKRTPASVDKNNEMQVRKTLYQPQAETARARFNVGDTVRISKHRRLFRKGYKQTFTDEYFTITERLSTVPTVYKLCDLAGEAVRGTFYHKELQPVIINKNKPYKIEKILAKRGKKLLVRWAGWPEKFNTWVDAKDVVDI